MLPSIRRRLTDRAALAVFALLAVTWLLPQAVGAVDALRWLLPLTSALVVPAYLLSMLVYDGFLEAPVYPVAGALPAADPYLWDLGLLVVFYGFAVLAVALGRSLVVRYRPAAGEVRTTVVGLFVLFGAVLLIGGAVGAVVTPTTVVRVCWESGSGASGASRGCYTETSFNATPYWMSGGGLVLSALGGVVLTGTDRLRERLAAA